ncbi:MAG TPA: TadE/TadG family type IV pilus assembly protein [Stellaceae bacterium]|nr:TadE/TadG family type IV pilus assembly protein [Stellaceae bacterium]
MRLFGRMKRWWARLDASGAAAVEFAIVGSTFMMMLLACFEFGYMLFVQSVLDNAARDAARLIRTGQVQGASNPTSTFQTLLCNEVGSIIGCGNIVYQSQVFNDWSSAQTSLNTPPTRDSNGNLISAGFTPGTLSQIVVVTVTYNYPFFTPWIASMLGGGTDSALLMSTVVFQNEPF